MTPFPRFPRFLHLPPRSFLPSSSRFLRLSPRARRSGPHRLAHLNAPVGLSGVRRRTGAQGPPAPPGHASGPPGHASGPDTPAARSARAARSRSARAADSRSARAADSRSPRSSGSPRDWAELLRISAPASVPGDLLAGAAAAGLRPNTRTALATLSSLFLYEAGMALNDWADRDIDALERPHRPLPSGRITPTAALAAAGGLTAAGLAFAAAAGRPALVTGTALAATVWAYDLHLKNTPAGPAAMACARTLDLLQGAIATTAPDAPTSPAARRALPSAALLGAHTFTVTTVSRRETQGSSTALPLLSLAAITALSHAAGARFPSRGPHASRSPGRTETVTARTSATASTTIASLLAAGYAATAARPLLVAALNPSPYFLQRAVGGGIRAMIPLQAALAARAGAPVIGSTVLALIPVARRLSRKVSPT
ncbi:SCO3242 family prenyltransferase [Streptomyces niger]|uniref:SCO3242 family prenyltransferase n=1 Tax=Streptomyces niger TaxID=66373 RepID=UPI000A77EB7E|nr:UbiA family prenyltransferase [Streptomyces niger]